ncbi:hypothetical protein BY996DRAFT_6414096 [Phakopsora pachyrhizi]|uniref:Expressed protein n=1 Tax=Phakopsora pachyrhizi TaxID=170000 RepID=A0AAV0AG65_PHAPC|nr:hypothetical protein BY996DRAFT_6427714 [Phakopsora pachyrhizi]KAI8445066.1 hypothetical protein BY996DRAFT_6424707 [Phakopsora pachyrhizi]KAI8454162.1 hypothetical protein BY996DRAFT_6414096 [Phakopsora pachyrhizi]CAH7665988.1 expressed protein [Phakopsora pachyrhizi]
MTTELRMSAIDQLQLEEATRTKAAIENILAASFDPSKPQTTSGNSLNWIPQQTRSGRIPQRPDPRNQPILDPLEFLNFPSDSESDDPDFQPTLHQHDHHRHQHHHQIPQSSSSRLIPIDPSLKYFQQSDVRPSRTAVGQSTKQPVRHSTKVANNRDGSGFDFPSLTDSNLNCLDWLNDSLRSNNHINSSNINNITSESTTTETLVRIKDEDEDGDEDLGHRQSSDSQSPLTMGELAGIPFVDIKLPDSEDSPEFIPPPLPATKRPRRAEPSLTRSSLQRQQKHHTQDILQRKNQRNNDTSNSPPRNRATSNTSSSSKNTAVYSPRRKARVEHQNKDRASSVASVPSYRSAHRTAFSNRLIEIAPSPSSPIEDRNRVMVLSDDEGEENEEKDRLDRSNQSSSLTKAVHIATAVAKLNHQHAFNKPGPKPKPKAQLSGHQREERLKRKRELMRAIRERKKEYIEELEDKCLALAEENARLKEENEQLMRESRENWKAKALLLNNQNSQPNSNNANKRICYNADSDKVSYSKHAPAPKSGNSYKFHSNSGNNFKK